MAEERQRETFESLKTIINSKGAGWRAFLVRDDGRFINPGLRKDLYLGVVKVIEDYNNWVESDSSAKELGFQVVDATKITTINDLNKARTIMRSNRP